MQGGQCQCQCQSWIYIAHKRKASNAMVLDIGEMSVCLPMRLSVKHLNCDKLEPTLLYPMEEHLS